MPATSTQASAPSSPSRTTDSDGERQGSELGTLLRTESDRLVIKNRRRARIRAVAQKASERGNHAKAARIARHNLGTGKKIRARRRFEGKARTITFEAVPSLPSKPPTLVADVLPRPHTA